MDICRRLLLAQCTFLKLLTSAILGFSDFLQPCLCLLLGYPNMYYIMEKLLRLYRILEALGFCYRYFNLRSVPVMHAYEIPIAHCWLEMEYKSLTGRQISESRVGRRILNWTWWKGGNRWGFSEKFHPKRKSWELCFCDKNLRKCFPKSVNQTFLP